VQTVQTEKSQRI